METQTPTDWMNRIRWKGHTYLISQEDLGAVFGAYGKPFLPCEAGTCALVEVIPTGRPNTYRQKCIYMAEKNLEWQVMDPGQTEFSEREHRCKVVDETLKEYIEAGHLKEFRQGAR